MYKPTGTFIHEATLVIGVAGVVAASVWLFSTGTEQKSVTTSQDGWTVVTDESYAYVPFDADDDGLLDWEEALWNTDPRDRDTDKDGTNDGEEVALRRNPKKAGPGDSLETPLIVVEQKEILPIPKRTSEVITPATESVPLLSAEPEKIQGEDSLYIFGNALGALIQTAAIDSDAELAFWNSAAGNTKMNEGLILGFTELAKKYKELATNIAKIVPPQKGVVVHAMLFRAYQNYAKAIQAIAETPIASYMSSVSITTYADTAVALGRAFVDVSDLFYEEGISFDQTSPGNIFMFPR